MKKIIKNKIPDEKHLNGVLFNILSISITFFLTISSSLFFLGKLENRIKTNEDNISILKNDIETFKNYDNEKTLELFKINNQILDNKLYIYETYKNQEERDRLLKITEDNFNKQINNIIKNPTK